MQVVLIRTNGVNPDPRVEKEVNSILKDGTNSVTILSWDRESKIDTDSLLQLANGTAKIIRFGIPSEWGGGFKKNLIPLIKFTLRVKRWLKKNVNSYDCIHCCDLPTAMMASPYIRSKKFVYDIYDYFADTAHAPKFILDYARKKEKQMIEEADVTIICSEQRLKQIGDAIPRKLVIIHNSPDSIVLNRVKAENQRIVLSDSPKKKIAYVGNLISERFIDIVADIVSLREDLELHIGGFGPLAGMFEQMSQKYNNIFFYGKMIYSNVLLLESECDIMLALYNPDVPNNRYAAPNKFYEGLFLGKPLIMCKNTGMDQFVYDNGFGVVVDPNRESIEKGIDYLLYDSNCFSEIVSDKMKETYERMYSWDIMEDRICKIYKQL